MTIDEAIEQFKYDAEQNMADLDLSYAEDNEQLAEWLEELKAYRASVFSGEMTQKMLKEEYNKAVDDFAKLLRETRDDRTLRVNCDDLEIRHMAERLKGGDGE